MSEFIRLRANGVDAFPDASTENTYRPNGTSVENALVALESNVTTLGGVAGDAKTLAEQNSVKIATAEQEISGINSSIGMDLLWENPNPTNSFEGQTLNFDMSKYKAFVIGAKSQNGDMPITYNYIPNVVVNDDIALWANHYKFRIRFIQITSTGIVFKAAYKVETYGIPENDQSVAVPLKIWGIK